MRCLLLLRIGINKFVALQNRLFCRNDFEDSRIQKSPKLLEIYNSSVRKYSCDIE